MKSIFTKLSTLLLCGAVTMIGCTDFSADLQELDKQNDATAKELADLQTAVEELEAELEEQYATKEEVADLLATIEALEAELAEKAAQLEEALGGKADKSELEAAKEEIAAVVADLQAQLTTALESLAALQTENESLKTTVEGLTAQITDLQTQIGALEVALDSLSQSVTNELDLVYGQIDELQGTIDDLQDDLAALEEEFEAYVEATDAELAAIKTAHDELAADVAELEDMYAELAAADGTLRTELEAAIAAAQADATAKYNELKTALAAIEDRLDAIENRVDALETSLRSIVMVPGLLVDGVNAVEFSSFVYAPMAADNDDVPVVADVDPATVKTIAFPTYAYYHFNPSTFDLAAADYSVVSALVETRAAGDPVAEVKSVVAEGGKVKVELVRAQGTDNMFALAATLKADGAVVYSDYAQIIDDNLNATDIKILNKDGVELSYTLTDAHAAPADVVIDSDQPFTLADYVQVEGIDLDAYGLSLSYSIVYGDIKVAADGTIDMTNIGGVSIAKVELVDAEGAVIRRAYVKFDITKIEVLFPGVYYKSTATATVQAERIAFEVKDIYVWAKALKDEPNTIEILKQVAVIAKDIATIQLSDQDQIQKTYLITQKAKEAYTLLNGVPGFVKKYTTFTATAEGKAKVDVLPKVEDVRELKAVLEMIEETYPQFDVMSELAHKIESYIPANLKDNWLIQTVLDGLKSFQLSDILENESVIYLLESGQAIAERLGYDFLDYDAINNTLEQIVKGIVGDANYGETAAKISAQAKARAAAEQALIDNYNAANENLLANFENGTWGQLVNLLETDLNLDNAIVAKILETLNLTDIVNTIQTVLPAIADQGRELVKYTYDADQIEYVVTTPERFEVQ